ILHLHFVYLITSSFLTTATINYIYIISLHDALPILGTNQHLIRSIVAIREQGGNELKNGDVIMPDPILVGRREYRLKELVEEHRSEEHTSELQSRFDLVCRLLLEKKK